MERIFKILGILSLFSLLLLTSCGRDKPITTVATSNNLLSTEECACNFSEMPVCGLNKNGIPSSYTNICTANCVGATNIIQGHCICSEKLVCLSDGRTLTECNAQAAITNDHSLTITKFYGCNSTPPVTL